MNYALFPLFSGALSFLSTLWKRLGRKRLLTKDIFMLDNCGADYNFFYLASTNLEVWGSQFKSLSHVPSTSTADYNSLSPALRRECRCPG